MFVYVLTENEANEGGTVAGVYSTEEKAREAIARLGEREGIFFWEVLRIEVDGPSGEGVAVRLD
jgi:hypothetical protein